MADEHAVSPGQELGERVFQEMAIWRGAHPRATFAEIEAAVEDRLDALRAELIQQEIAMRASAETAEGTEPVPCPTCGQLMEARGTRERGVAIQGNRPGAGAAPISRVPHVWSGAFPPWIGNWA